MIYCKLWLNVLIGLLLYTRIYGQLALNMPEVGNYGEETHMNCTEASFNITHGYTWYKNTSLIYDNKNGDATGKYTSTHGNGFFTLTITNTVVNDAGEYVCYYNFNQESGTLKIQAQGTFTAKLSSSKHLQVTLKQIYPNTTSANITCDSNKLAGSFVSSVADGDRFTCKWQSTNTFSTLPSSCSASVQLGSEIIISGISFTALIIVVAIVAASLVYILCTSIPGGIVISEYSCGAGACYYLANTRPLFCNCIICWKPKCCVRCARKICDSCKNCNVKGLPFWYRILWLSVIGIPVALGILTVWKVYRICCKNAIRYVLITDDGTSINHDGTWTLGASVGAFCVTKVTARGPADGKLKVGDQMNKINGITVTGENQNQIFAMLNDKENLTLDVSQVGSVSTTDSVVELKREELGFKYEYIAMVTNVTERSKAEGKMEKGDLILSINGKSTAGKSNAEVNKELEKPQIMEMSIKRGKKHKTIKLDLKVQASLGIAIEKKGDNIEVSNIESKSAAAISGEIQVNDCILSVNGVSTAGLKVIEIEEMLTLSIILKVTKDVTVLELDSDLKGSIGVKNASANTVISVKAKGPAALAGIQEGDEIHKIDGKSTKTMTVKQIAKMIASREKTVIFESARGEFTVERDTNGSLGLELSSTPNVVYKVDGNAALSGKVKPGDTIVSINGKKTKGKSHQEIKTMLESSGGSISLKLKEAVTENGYPHRTSGHGDQGAGTNDIEMG